MYVELAYVVSAGVALSGEKVTAIIWGNMPEADQVAANSVVITAVAAVTVVATGAVQIYVAKHQQQRKQSAALVKVCGQVSGKRSHQDLLELVKTRERQPQQRSPPLLPGPRCGWRLT